jgi:hypothetical protein
VSEENLLQSAIGGIADAAKWILARLDGPTLKAIYADLGMQPPGTSEEPVFPDMSERFDSIDVYRKAQKPDAAAMKAAVEDIKAIRQAIRNGVHAWQGGSVPDATFDAAVRLMTSNYLRLQVPLIYWIGQPLGFIQDAYSVGAIPRKGTGQVGQSIGDFFNDPIDYLSRHLGSLETEVDARRVSHAVLAPAAVIYTVAQKLMAKDSPITVLYGYDPDTGSTTPLGDRISQRTLSFVHYTPASTGFPAVQGSVLATLALVPREHGGPGLFVSVGGDVELSSTSGGWTYKSKLGSASAASLMIGSWESATGPADASVEFTIARVPNPSGFPYTVDLGKRVRLDFGDFAFSAGLSPAGPRLRLSTGKSVFVLESSSDAVLERGMPPNADAFRMEFDLTLGLANGKFSFEGGSGLRVTLPVSKKLGPVQARGLTLGLVPGSQPDQPAVSFEVTATIVITLGPFTLTVDRLGLTAGVSRDGFPDAGFRPPNGVGVLLKSEAVSGGGYISFDQAAHQYAGILTLSIKDKITLTAIGILNTRIDDRPAFSFLIILTATGFPPISLGLGFKLTGIGGLLGLDREVNFEALERGIKEKNLDRLLFPPDPVANSTEIVTACSAVFPPKRGQTIFGPMLQVTWGSSSLVRLELAVIIQVPSVKVAILGKLRAFFPTEKKPILKIQIDLIGTIDFDRKRAFAHAKLTASKLAGFDLTGSAAMLLYWGDNSTYIISFGGFNERYKQVPADFPKLDRLALAFAPSKNLKLSFTFYCAITSNSFQIGGSFEAKYEKGKFGVKGLIKADALFQSGQPSCIFDLVASLQLTAWGVNLFKVEFKGTLSGTEPWHIVGSVSFEIWIFDYSISINETFGDDPAGPEQLAAVNVAALVQAELSDIRNWTVDVPASARSLVTLRQTTGMVLHPLGTLNIVQRVVPLDVNISRFGESRPRGQTMFGIERVKIGADDATVDDVREQFARAQFVEMTNDEKLAAPAFEPLKAGVRINAASLRNGPVVEATTEYSTLVWDDAAGAAVPDAPYGLRTDLLFALATTGPAAKAAGARANGQQYRGPSRPAVVGSIAYVIASTDDLAAAPDAGAPTNYTTAKASLKTYLAANPQQRDKVQLLPVTR